MNIIFRFSIGLTMVCLSAIISNIIMIVEIDKNNNNYKQTECLVDVTDNTSILILENICDQNITLSLNFTVLTATLSCFYCCPDLYYIDPRQSIKYYLYF